MSLTSVAIITTILTNISVSVAKVSQIMQRMETEGRKEFTPEERQALMDEYRRSFEELEEEIKRREGGN